MKLYAKPYAFDAEGFYFETFAEYEEQYESRLPVEEYAIEFIDGTDEQAEFFALAKVRPGNLKAFFDAWEHIEGDDLLVATVAYCLWRGDTLDYACSNAKDVSLFEGTTEEYAEEYVNDCVFTRDTPEVLKTYFNYEAFARDLELNGDVKVFVFSNREYVVSGE